MVMAASLLALLAMVGLRPRDYLLDAWRSDLKALPDEQVPVKLQQISGLGGDGVPVLVELLGSDRRVVSAAARTALENLLIRWRALPSKDSSPRVARLARLLAQWVGGFGVGAYGSGFPLPELPEERGGLGREAVFPVSEIVFEDARARLPPPAHDLREPRVLLLRE